MLKVEGALMENQSLRANGSVRFFKPFLPFDNLLFFPTAMIATVWGKVETGGDGSNALMSCAGDFPPLPSGWCGMTLASLGGA